MAKTPGLSEARLGEIEAHVARRHAAGGLSGHDADGEWWSVLDEYRRDTTALVAEVRRLREALQEVADSGYNICSECERLSRHARAAVGGPP